MSKKISAKDFAESMAGYDGSDLSIERMAEAKENGIVVVFGVGRSAIAFRGAMTGTYETSISGLSQFYLDNIGLIVNTCDDSRCPYYADKSSHATRISVADGKVFPIKGRGYPHNESEDDIKSYEFSKGIAFDYSDLPERPE